MCLDDDWLTRTENSSLGKLLFKDGIYDMKEGLFKKGFDTNIIFHTRIPYDFPPRDEIKVENAMKLSLRSLFIDPTQMQIFLARALAGDNLKKVYFCHGKSDTGKSMLVKMLHISFGGYVDIFNGDHLTYTERGRNQESRKQWPMSSRWCRILCSNDVNTYKPLNANEIMKHSSRDRMIGKSLLSSETFFTPHYTMFCMVNELPKIKLQDKIIEERLEYINFRHAFGVEAGCKPKIMDFDTVIRSESFIRGFIHVILDGYKLYQINGTPKI